jgi:gamma-glutamylaminecyclotransferase
MTRVFVYGTLLAGEGNHHLLASARLIAPAQTLPEYSMADFGGFPAVTAGGTVTIAGEVYEVDGPTLEALDRLERHPRWYVRTPIRLADGTHAQTYLMRPEQVEGLPSVASGDWRTRTTTWRTR